MDSWRFSVVKHTRLTVRLAVHIMLFSSVLLLFELNPIVTTGRLASTEFLFSASN